MIIPEESNISVSFSISLHGKTHSFDAEFEDTASWTEVLDELVKTLEASYGYSFDLPVETEYGHVGVYYKGKNNDSE